MTFGLLRHRSLKPRRQLRDAVARGLLGLGRCGFADARVVDRRVILVSGV